MIEGSLEQPATPESEELVKLLKDNGVRFAAIDLKKKPEVHELLR